MYHVLIILLHHPFVADGHLYNTSRSISVNSLMCCATAANDIVQLVRVFDEAFSIRRAPYLISYATYVAATIHARIAAQRGSGSDAHSSLGTCLAVFRENQETNPAVRRANALVQNLMKRMGLRFNSIADCQIHRPTTSNSEQASLYTERNRSIDHRHRLQSLDIDGIIQSFVREQEHAQVALAGTPENNNSSNAATPVQMPPPPPHNIDANLPTYDYNSAWLGSGQHEPYGQSLIPVDDLYYGFNSAALDSFSITPFFE